MSLPRGVLGTRGPAHRLPPRLLQNSPNNISGISNPPGTPRDDGELGGNFLHSFQNDNVSPWGWARPTPGAQPEAVRRGGRLPPSSFLTEVLLFASCPGTKGGGGRKTWGGCGWVQAWVLPGRRDAGGTEERRTWERLPRDGGQLGQAARLPASIPGAARVPPNQFNGTGWPPPPELPAQVWALGSPRAGSAPCGRQPGRRAGSGAVPGHGPLSCFYYISVMYMRAF